MDMVTDVDAVQTLVRQLKSFHSDARFANFLKDIASKYRGGVHGLRMDGGLPSGVRFSERYPLLITETCCHTHFYDEFWRKTTHFWQCFANSLISHPCLWKICRKGDPCLENFSPKAHPYGRHIPVPSTCFVPPLHGKQMWHQR